MMRRKGRLQVGSDADITVFDAERENVRVFAILLDDYHVPRGRSMAVRDTLASFIREHVRPNDLLTVMYPLTPVTDVSFTRDHDAVIRAIGAFEGRKLRYQARNDFERQYEQQPTEVVENVRNQVSMSALRGLATRQPPLFNVIISNVPGPRDPLYWNGLRLTGMYPLSAIAIWQASPGKVRAVAGKIAHR